MWSTKMLTLVITWIFRYNHIVVIIGASVSEPHTSGFNAAFSLLYVWTCVCHL